ncbi:MAG: hypothetical protein ACRELV_08390 [Longimicrobiales bacterium]
MTHINGLAMTTLDLAMLLTVAACGIGEGPASPVVLEGELRTIGNAVLITGSAAAVSRGDRTQATIAIHGADPESTYVWRLRVDRCSAPGTVVGGLAAYPPLLTDEAGEAAAEATLTEPLRRGHEYHAIVLTAAPPQTPVACGDLEPFSSP